MVTEAEQLSFQEKGQWLPIPRLGRTIPFGYEPDPEDGKVLLPIIHELEALEEAKKYLKQYSYRVVAVWLTEQTGRYISHLGLKKRAENDRRRGRKATTLKAWAKRAEEARAKAEKFETQRLGARTPQPEPDISD